MASPLPNTKAPALVKNQRIWPSVPSEAGSPRPCTSAAGSGSPAQSETRERTRRPSQRGGAPESSRGGEGEAGGAPERGGRRVDDEGDHAAEDEERRDLGLRPGGDDGHDDEDRPAQAVGAEREPGQPVGGPDDDADHRRPDPVE